MKKKFLLFLIAALPALAFATNGTWQGTGTVNDPYRIADLADLKVLIPDDGNSNYQDKVFVLIADIADDGTLCPIGSNGKAFEGTFEGDGHTITLNMNNSASRDALFDCLGGKGVIRNLIVAGSVYGSEGTHDEVAGICAWNYGIIDRCHNMAQATENNCTMGCAGICTKNYGTIINCWNSGKITSSESSSGGIVSKNYGIIKNCYNSGEISGNEACGIANSSPGPTLVNCYNSGSLSGRWLRPIISIGMCDSCYYEKGDFRTDYGTSLNASQMTDGTLLDYLNAYASTDSTLMTWVANGQGYPGFAPFHTHTFATEWSHDSISHWHAASCHDGSTCSWARSDNAPHQWSSNKPVEGEAYYTCQVCGYQDNERKTIAVTLVNVTCTLGDQATFAFKAIAGQASTVDITPAQGWEVETVTIDGTDATGLLTGTTLSFTPTDATAINVTFVWSDIEHLYTEKDIPTGAYSITTDDGVGVYTDQNGNINMDYVKGKELRVYSIGGSLITTQTPGTESIVLDLPQGTYIITVGNEAMKIYVK